jgi:thiamine-phosphate pyrophosphorylase
MNFTSILHSISEIAHAVSNHHANLLVGEPQDFAQCANVLPSELPEKPFAIEMQGVFIGCKMLGFVDHDAQCIMQAWEKQSIRSGLFELTRWPSIASDFGMSAYPRENAFAPCPQHLGLYVVLPNANWVARMAKVGVPTIQLRYKSEDKVAIAKEVSAAVEAVQGTNALLFINDHWEEAIAKGAYGVHLGQEDIQDAPLEKIRAAGLRLGISTHGYAEMLLADRHSPSYIALGAVFPTTLKRMATAPQGMERLKRYVQLMQHYPLVAIGGIDLDRLPAVVQTGVGSVAVVRAITESANPEDTASLFQQCIKRANLPG